MSNIYYLVRFSPGGFYSHITSYTQDIHLLHDYLEQYNFENYQCFEFEAENEIDFSERVHKELGLIISIGNDKLFRHVSWDNHYSIVTSFSHIDEEDLYTQWMQMFESFVKAWYSLVILQDYTKDGYRTEFKNFLLFLSKYIIRLILFDRVEFDDIKIECRKDLGFNDDDEYVVDELIDDYTIYAILEKGSLF